MVWYSGAYGMVWHAWYRIQGAWGPWPPFLDVRQSAAGISDVPEIGCRVKTPKPRAADCAALGCLRYFNPIIPAIFYFDAPRLCAPLGQVPPPRDLPIPLLISTCATGSGYDVISGTASD